MGAGFTVSAVTETETDLEPDGGEAEQSVCCVLMFSVFLFQATGLHFRHTDNVIQWLNAMAEKGLPKVSVAHITHTHTDQ